MNRQRRHELTDEQWRRLAPLLPPEKPPTGRPNKEHRAVINGILWILRTGAPWRDLPERYGPWKTVYSRFTRWQQVGIWDRILTELQAEAAHEDGLDGSLSMIDSSSIRAHQHAAGARKKGHIRPGLRSQSGRVWLEVASGDRARGQTALLAADGRSAP
jgi:transposase